LRPVANIKVGDVGPKIGMEKTDTGYLHISGIKVPYESMLMKYNKIEKNGEYKIHK
jgi:acyl-CoA oxidase